jgi:hypothetical protein
MIYERRNKKGINKYQKIPSDNNASGLTFFQSWFSPLDVIQVEYFVDGIILVQLSST